MSTERATYSTIIDPKTYRALMTKQHRYIQESDERIIAAIKREKENIDRELEVVELGCDPLD